MIATSQIELQSDGRFNVIVLTDRVAEFVAGATPKKLIVVPGKIVNIVV